MGCGASSSNEGVTHDDGHRNGGAAVMRKYKGPQSVSAGECTAGSGGCGGELWKDPSMKPSMSAAQRADMLRVYASTFRTVRYILATIGRIKSTMKKWVVEARNRIRERKQREARGRLEEQQRLQQPFLQAVAVATTAGGDDAGDAQGPTKLDPTAGAATTLAAAAPSPSDLEPVENAEIVGNADGSPTELVLVEEKSCSPEAEDSEMRRRRASTPFQTSVVDESGSPSVTPLYINAVVSLNADGNAHEPPQGRHRRSVMSISTELDAIISRKASRVDYISAGSLLIAQRMAHLGLVQHTMEDDGNCQFRAIAHQIFNDPEQHGAVRKAICDFMRARKHEEYDFLFETEEECDDYLLLMETEGTFGDELTLRAACDTFGIVLHLITSEEQDYYVKYVPNFAAVGVDEDAYFDTLDVFLAFVHPVHYNSIVTKSAT